MCTKPSELPAPKIFKTFMENANVKTCYSHFVELAEQSPKEANSKICSTIQGFSKHLVEKFTQEKFSKKNPIRKASGLIGKCIGKGFGACVKGFALDGLVNSKEDVGDTFLAAESDEPETPSEKKPSGAETKSIAQILKDIKDPDKALFAQVASVCAAKVLTSMGNNRDRVVEEILNVHKKEERKGPPAFVKKIMEYSIPLFIDHCVDNQKDWLTFAAMLGQKAFEIEKLKNSLDLEDFS